MGRPPGADGDQTRDRIIDAALQAFAVHGYDAMSVRELTRQLGVSHNLVHHYFGSKSDLWYAAIDHNFSSSTEEVLGELAQAIGDPEPEKAVRRLLELTFRNAALHPAALAIAADESHRGGERLDYLYEHFLAPGIEMVGRFLEAARPYPICEIDPKILALHVWNATTSMATRSALFEKLGYHSSKPNEPLGEYAEAAIDILVNGLFRSAP